MVVSGLAAYDEIKVSDGNARRICECQCKAFKTHFFPWEFSKLQFFISGRLKNKFGCS